MPKPDMNLGSKDDDILSGDSNGAVLRGGRGDDTYYIDQVGVSVDEKNNGGIDNVKASVSYWLDKNVENLTLMGLEDIDGSGNELNNEIFGNTGANTLSGLEGSDSIYGGEGDDVLIGGAGSDILDGGDGDDAAIFEGSISDYSFAVEGDYVFVTSADGHQDQLTNIETLSFSDAIVLVLEFMSSNDDGSATTDDPALPYALDDFGAVNSGDQLVLAVLANDSGDGITIASTVDGINGAVTINEDGTLTYHPNEGTTGEDVFSYTIIDSLGRTASAEVFVSISEPATSSEPTTNTAPIAQHDAFTAVSGRTLQGAESLLWNDSDPDGDILSVAGFDPTSSGGGAVSVNSDGTFSYASATGFIGTDTFTYSVEDGRGGLATATVNIEVVEDQSADTPYYITGLISGAEDRYNPNDAMGSATTVTFAFAETTPDYYYENHFAWTDFQAFSDDMKVITRQVLEDISGFTNITFIETSPEEAAMMFGIADITGSARGLAYYPDEFSVGAPAGDVWIASGLSGLSFEPGTEEYKTLIHEIGHSLGLKHADLPLEEDNRQYTVMTGIEHPTFGGDASSFLLYDVAGIQHLYGANQTATSGDDTYTHDMLGDSLRSIWDAGGHDTIDLSSAAYGVDLDLREGAFSTVSGSGSNNISLAFGTVIEDALGSAHDDIITGNDVGNFIYGGDGNDIMSGGQGADVFGFGGSSGTDVISDFISGEDRLTFNGSETSISDLFVTLQEGGILIEHSGGSIQLEGVEEINEQDLIFSVI